VEGRIGGCETGMDSGDGVDKTRAVDILDDVDSVVSVRSPKSTEKIREKE